MLIFMFHFNLCILIIVNYFGILLLVTIIRVNENSVIFSFFWDQVVDFVSQIVDDLLDVMKIKGWRSSQMMKWSFVLVDDEEEILKMFAIILLFELMSKTSYRDRHVWPLLFYETKLLIKETGECGNLQRKHVRMSDWQCAWLKWGVVRMSEKWWSRKKLSTSLDVTRSVFQWSWEYIRSSNANMCLFQQSKLELV